MPCTHQFLDTLTVPTTKINPANPAPVTSAHSTTTDRPVIVVPSDGQQALSYNGITGDYLEFGSWGARTFSMAYDEAVKHGHKAKLWAFDSFRGLPAGSGPKDEHPAWPQGAMAMSENDFHQACASAGIPRDRYRVVPGFYDESLAKYGLTEEPRDVAFVYIDCDLYSSTSSVLKFLSSRLKHGAIIAFDDYFCWSPDQPSGERMAMLEYFGEDSAWRLVPYIQFGWHGQSFVVEAAENTPTVSNTSQN